MRTLLIGLAAAVALSGGAYAKAKAPAAAASNVMAPTAAATPAPTPAKAAPKPRTAESLDCSKQADGKGLHGKDRNKFRSACIKQEKAK